MNYLVRKLFIGVLLSMGLLSGANANYVGGNPVSRVDPYGLYCITGSGTTSCVVPGGPGLGDLPTPKGFPKELGIGAPDSQYHKYHVSRDLRGADPECVFRKMANSPTPGNSNPATKDGTQNNAEVVSGWSNPVTSYLTADPVLKTQVAVNMAGSGDGSAFGPGYVAQWTGQGKAHTAGEGTSALQTPLPGLGAMQTLGNEYVWGRRLDKFIDECLCEKK
jgi:hypothetical protein